MDLMTRVDIARPGFEIGHDTPMLVVGSCFAQNVGQRLVEGLFDVVLNPTGVVYNPMSIGRVVTMIADSQNVEKDELFIQDGLYHSWDFHSSLSSHDPETALKKMNDSLEEAREQLKRTKVVVLTFGSTRYYRLKADGRIVANCHKVAQSNFDLINASSKEIFDETSELVERLTGLNKDIKIIVTVSPVRYKAYGYHESGLMKSRLLIMCDELVQKYPDTVSYFPSYEIMMDELRDYRFYADDMIHPSGLAVKYIYERFGDTYFSEKTKLLVKRAEQLVKRATHRFMGDNQLQADEFKKETERLTRQIAQECPAMERSIKKLIL